jgi:signal transduction histidine kinase
MGTTQQRAVDTGRSSGAHRSSVWPALIIATGYYIGTKLGFALTLAPVPVSVLWPTNAILLAGLFLTSVRAWPLVLTAVFGAHLGAQSLNGVPMVMVLCWFVSNCSEALIGVALLRRFSGSWLSFDSFRSTALFFGCAGLAAPFVSSFVDAAFVVANGWGNADYWTIWRTRFASNVLATLTLVPVIVLTVEHLGRFKEVTRRKLAEAIAVFALLGVVCWIVFVRQEPGPGTSPALLYSPLLLLFASAVRFGPWGASASILICAMVAIWGALIGRGPFITSSPSENALAIQAFLIVAWIPVMSLASVMRERASANAQARRSEEQLAMAIEAAQLGRWEFEIATQELTWSAITRRIYEVPPDVPVSPATFQALIHPDDRPLIAAAAVDGLSGRPIDVEFRVLFSDGRIKWILSKGQTVYDDEGRPQRMVGVKLDITARKAAELRINEHRRELAHLSRVSIADELSAALAHEVNQPLAAILANASAARRFLLHNPPDLRELSDIVESIAADNRRAASVIARFGALMRRGDSTWATLEINEMVRSVIDVARVDILSRGVSLTQRLASDLPAIVGDAVQLQQVLLNLIINGCDAMESVPARERKLLVTTSLDGAGYVCVHVSDNGPGIDAESLDRMFEPFVTSKPQRLGLGLAICRSIISAHDGHLSAENQPRRGAAFSFALPATNVSNALPSNIDRTASTS